MMTPQELDEIMKRHASAERGWHLVPDDEDPYHFTLQGDGPTTIAEFGGNPDDGSASYTTEENAEFAVHAYDDVPRLVAEVRRLQAALNQGANTTDPLPILRLALEQLRLTSEHNMSRAENAEKARDSANANLRFLREDVLPGLERQVKAQREGKERWRDRAIKAESQLPAPAGAPSTCSQCDREVPPGAVYCSTACRNLDDRHDDGREADGEQVQP